VSVALGRLGTLRRGGGREREEEEERRGEERRERRERGGTLEPFFSGRSRSNSVETRNSLSLDLPLEP